MFGSRSLATWFALSVCFAALQAAAEPAEPAEPVQPEADRLVEPEPDAEPDTPSADDLSAARLLVQQASQSYELAQFPEALQLYEQAYAHAPLPGLLFNLGQCHFALKDYEQAVFYYQGFLRGAPESSRVEMVRGLVAEAEELLQTQRAEAERLRAQAERDQLAREEKERVAAQAALERKQTERLAAESDRLDAEARLAEANANEVDPLLLWGGAGAAAAALVVAVGVTAIVVAVAVAPSGPADTLPTPIDLTEGM